MLKKNVMLLKNLTNVCDHSQLAPKINFSSDANISLKNTMIGWGRDQGKR